jgi:HSP20 family protein
MEVLAMALPSVLPFRRDRDLAPAQSDPFFTLKREVDRLFDEAFRGFGFGAAFAALDNAIWSPKVDVRETENSVEVSAELPGVDEKDIEVTVADGVLTLRGEKKIDRTDKGQGWHVMERSHGTFVRSIALPMEVDESKATAQFKNGVLHVSLPAAPEAERKIHRIKVNG